MQGKNHIEPPANIELNPAHNLALEQRPEWRNVKIGENFRSDFSILGGHILISRPSGYATLPDVQKSISLNHDVRRAGIPDNLPYIQIEDYSNMTGASLSSRKYFIDIISKQESLLALIFCGVTPIMKMGIELGKRIYSKPFDVYSKPSDVQVTSTLSEAVDMALRILKQKNIILHDAIGSFTEPDDSPGVRCENNWMIQADDFSLRIEIIDGDILHTVPSGFIQKSHIDKIFELHHEVFIQSGLKANAYYLVSDLASLKSADMGTRRYFVKRLREWHSSHPFKILIFYHANWIMRAAINISKTTAPYDVHVVESIKDAISLIRGHRSFQKQPEHDKTKACETPQDQSIKYINELLDILSGISWDSQPPESILQKIDAGHPLRPVVEAVSLIKMDVDHLLAEKERSEKALRETSERYKTILDNIEEGYYEVDLAGNLTFFNPSLASILGYTAEELTGLNYRAFSSEKYVDIIFKTFNQVYRTGIPAMAIDWKLNRKDGVRCYIEASVALIKDRHDAVTGFRGICRDITQRVASEQEKQNMKDRLRHAQKMEAIGTLAGGVAHDLNNILSGIVSYPDLLMMKLPPDSPIRKPLETIKKSGERAAAIVLDLLTLARQGMNSREILNLNAIITDHLKSPEHSYQMALHPGVGIKIALDHRLLTIQGSSIHIVKILMNVISNAAEAMPEGGEIFISTENCYMDALLPDLPSLKKGEYVLLKIKDPGIGISDTDKERIFEPFYTKKVMGRSGTGLGMAMVWGAVRDHDGYIDVQSAPEKGTTISIYLPASRIPAVRIPEELPLDGFKGKGEIVLVVDDLEQQRELASDILTQLGYAVETAVSGENAIELLKTHPVDLVILDMIMHPGMDGLDTYKEIIKIHPAQKVIIATGFSTSDRIKTAQSLGAGTCLNKPYLIKDFARTVREELDR